MSDKGIDQLIEEELVVCEVCGGETVKMSSNCPVHGGPTWSAYSEYRLRVEEYLQRVESSRRAGMPGPPKWSAKEKRQKEVSHLSLVIGLTNLVVCCIVGLAVALVVLELFN